MYLSDFVYNPANILFQASESFLYMQAQIHTCLYEYDNDNQTEFKHQCDTLFKLQPHKFKDRP